MYERVVTLAYILKHPEKVDRFIHYAAVGEHRMIQEARRLFSDEEINASFRDNSIEAIQENYEKYKAKFLRKDGKRVAPSWDVDFASQVRDLGSPFLDYYLSAYLLPNSHVHATLTSIMLPAERQPPELHADLTLMMAHVLFIKVIELHAPLFGLSIDAELDQCNGDFQDAWLAQRSP